MGSPLRILFICLFIGAFVLVATSACTGSDPAQTRIVYVTQYGLGPDKWATAWLLTHRPGANATLVVEESGAPLVAGAPFDVPGAEYRRIGQRAAFEVARDALAIDDPAVATLAQIVHEIEVNFWSSDGPAEAVIVEDAFRALQHRYGRKAVTPHCYVAFFDRVYQVLRDSAARRISLNADRLRMDCDELVQLSHQRSEIVPETPIADVLSAMASGRRVVFVDVREPDEYAEAHIPGALNIPLRDVGAHLADRFKGADYVVSYCVKDFRGFEMAKALADVGVSNSVIMRPYGIKGWAALGLPISGARALSDEAARALLAQCLASHGECLSQRQAPLRSAT